jgi:hypothetical protein
VWKDGGQHSVRCAVLRDSSPSLKKGKSHGAPSERTSTPALEDIVLDMLAGDTSSSTLRTARRWPSRCPHNPPGPWPVPIPLHAGPRPYASWSSSSSPVLWVACTGTWTGSRICWTYLVGGRSSYNSHWRSRDNPHIIRERSHQDRLGIKLWTCIIGNNVIGSHILPHWLNDPLCCVFLREVYQCYLKMYQ